MTDERASRKSRARSRQWPSSATRRCNRQPTPNCRPLLAATLPLPPVTWLSRELPFRSEPSAILIVSIFGGGIDAHDFTSEPHADHRKGIFGCASSRREIHAIKV